MNPFFIFAIVGAIIITLIFLVSRLLRDESSGDSSQIECGMQTVGDSRSIGFRYFNYAVLFLIFEIAGLFFFLSAYYKLNLTTLFTIVFLTLTLGIAIIWAVRADLDAV